MFDRDGEAADVDPASAADRVGSSRVAGTTHAAIERDRRPGGWVGAAIRGRIAGVVGGITRDRLDALIAGQGRLCATTEQQGVRWALA